MLIHHEERIMKKEFCTKLEILFLCFYFFMKKFYTWSYINFFKKLIIIESLRTKMSQEREMHHLSLRRHLDKNMRQHLLKRLSIHHSPAGGMDGNQTWGLVQFCISCDIMHFSPVYEFYVLFTLMNFLCVQHTLFSLPWN